MAGLFKISDPFADDLTASQQERWMSPQPAPTPSAKGELDAEGGRSLRGEEGVAAAGQGGNVAQKLDFSAIPGDSEVAPRPKTERSQLSRGGAITDEFSNVLRSRNHNSLTWDSHDIALKKHRSTTLGTTNELWQAGGRTGNHFREDWSVWPEHPTPSAPQQPCAPQAPPPLENGTGQWSEGNVSQDGGSRRENPWRGISPKSSPFSFHQDEREMVKNLLTMCTLDVCVPNLMAQSRCPEAEFFLAEQGKKLREALGFGESLFVSGRTKWTQNLAEGSEVPWQIAASVKSVSLERSRSRGCTWLPGTSACFSSTADGGEAEQANECTMQVHCPGEKPQEKSFKIGEGRRVTFDIESATREVQIVLMVMSGGTKECKGTCNVNRCKFDTCSGEFLVHLVRNSMRPATFHGRGVMHNQILQWMQSDDAGTEGSARLDVEVQERRPTSDGVVGSGSWTFGRYYDVLLDAALRDSGFAQRVLDLRTEWNWLLQSCAHLWNLSTPYCTLRYILHITEVATPTEDCLEVLRCYLPSVVQKNSENQLSEQEARMLTDVKARLNRLFEKTMSNFKLLDENVLSGIAASPSSSSSKVNEGALRLMTQLYEMINDMTTTEAQRTVHRCLKEAARSTCDRALAMAQDGYGDGSESATYERLRAYCKFLREESQRDIGIESLFPVSRLLPGDLTGDSRLSALTAGVYCERIRGMLDTGLERCYPRHTSARVQDAIDDLWEYESQLAKEGLLHTISGYRLLNVKEKLNGYVLQWIESFKKRLYTAKVLLMRVYYPLPTFCLRFCAEAMHRANAQEELLVSLLGGNEAMRAMTTWFLQCKEMLAELERVLSRWPSYTPKVEESLCEVVSAILQGLQDQVQPHLSKYGGGLESLKKLVSKGHSKSQNHSRSKSKLKSLGSDALQGVDGQGGGTSVCKLPPALVGAVVALKVIDTEQYILKDRLLKYAGTQEVASDGGDGSTQGMERIGAHFEATLQHSVRTLYKSCLQEAVFRVSKPMIADPHTSPRLILRQSSGDSIQEHLQPLVSSVKAAVRDGARVLGSARAAVAVSRGMWDKLAEEVLHFVTDEMRQKGAGLQKATSASATLEALRGAFRDAIAECLSDVRDEDHQEPTSAREAASLLGNDPYGSLHVY